MRSGLNPVDCDLSFIARASLVLGVARIYSEELLLCQVADSRLVAGAHAVHRSTRAGKARCWELSEDEALVYSMQSA
jgi:hypothetical protein